MISYVGLEKNISKVKRTEVAFHAQRGIQEFSFDTLPSIKSEEIEIGPTLNFILPKDYVNYVKLVWIDSKGIERIIYPTSKTSNPLPILQDAEFEYLFDEQTGEMLTAEESETRKKFQAQNNTGDNNKEDLSDRLNQGGWGRRYGFLLSKHNRMVCFI